MPVWRTPGAARSRAAVRAVRFAIVPPLVVTPRVPSPNPTNSPTHATTSRSRRSAPPEDTATLTSWQAMSASPSTPISRPLEPT